MIIKFNDLKKYRGDVSMVDGCFDPLHRGHIAYFKVAHRLRLPVLCNIASDQYIKKNKGRPPFLSQKDRAGIIDSIRDISFTHINMRTTAVILKELQPRYYVKGKEWKGHLPDEEIQVCQRFGIEIVYTDTNLDSSSRILSDYFSKKNYARQIKDFEEFVFSQKPIPSSYYDQDYFTGDWRSKGNKYSLETRREIEGRNPELIKKVFRPKRVLDVGCGPGALMYLLYELGVSCDGIDFSPDSQKLAPPEVRDRIMRDSVTKMKISDNSYDLVICRELLEHLTVLQIQRAIKNLCRVSSRYVYVTTRFHPNPNSFLAITEDSSTDPTHITLLTKDFLRLLFVLEGYRRCPDLEKKMDWLKKGRVLVYEKQKNISI